MSELGDSVLAPITPASVRMHPAMISRHWRHKVRDCTTTPKNKSSEEIQMLLYDE